MWVETVSLGKVARSTMRTWYPFRASNIATGEPAHREYGGRRGTKAVPALSGLFARAPHALIANR